MKKICVIFTMLVFCAMSFAQNKGLNAGIPAWVTEYMNFTNSKKLRKLLNASDTDKLFVLENINKDAEKVENHLYFDLIEAIYSDMYRTVGNATGAYPSSAETSYSANGEVCLSLAMSTVGVEPVIGAISSSIEMKNNVVTHFEKKLITPSGEYDILDAERNYVLPDVGLTWLKLAFQLQMPEFSANLKKAGDYKYYNEKKKEYVYIAAYKADGKLFESEVRKMLQNASNNKMMKDDIQKKLMEIDAK